MVNSDFVQLLRQQESLTKVQRAQVRSALDEEQYKPVSLIASVLPTPNGASIAMPRQSSCDLWVSVMGRHVYDAPLAIKPAIYSLERLRRTYAGVNNGRFTLKP